MNRDQLIRTLPAIFIFLLRPIILRKGCIILCHSRAKIAHLAQQRIFSGIRLSDFYLLIAPYHPTKFENNPLSGP